jgi:hypothetical protein
MEATPGLVAILELATSIVQFLLVSHDLLSKSAVVCLSSDGTLRGDPKTTRLINRLHLLRNDFQNNTGANGDGDLQSLFESCQAVMDELSAPLKKVRAKESHQNFESQWKAIRDLYTREEVINVERRLANIRAQLSLHILQRLG